MLFVYEAIMWTVLHVCAPFVIALAHAPRVGNGKPKRF